MIWTILVNLCHSRSSGPPPSTALLACYLDYEDGNGKNNVDGNMISSWHQDDADYVDLNNFVNLCHSLVAAVHLHSRIFLHAFLMLLLWKWWCWQKNWTDCVYFEGSHNLTWVLWVPTLHIIREAPGNTIAFLTLFRRGEGGERGGYKIREGAECWGKR